MATLSAEQIQSLIFEAVQAGIRQGLEAAGQRGQAHAHVGGDRRIIDDKAFKRVKDFEGFEKESKDWASQFKVAAKTRNADIVKALERAETAGDEITTTQLGLEDEFLNIDIDLGKLSSEL